MLCMFLTLFKGITKMPKTLLYPLLVLAGILYGNGTITLGMIAAAVGAIFVIMFVLAVLAKIFMDDAEESKEDKKE